MDRGEGALMPVTKSDLIERLSDALKLPKGKASVVSASRSVAAAASRSGATRPTRAATRAPASPCT